MKLINEFSKVTGYKINMQISIVLLYICIKQYENEIGERIQFMIVLKRIKYWGINLTKEV